MLSNYRVRQVLALRLPDRQNRFMVALATWLNDDSRSVRVAFGTLIEEAGQARNTARAARRDLEAQGKLAVTGGGRGPGDKPLWTALCLPEKGVSDVDPLTDAKGVNDVDPVSDVDPLTDAKGVNGTTLRGSTDPEKGGQPESADLPKADTGLNRQAKPSGSSGTAGLIRSAFPDATADEIEAIMAERQARGARSVFWVIRHEIGQGTFRLPCDRGGSPSHSDACRSGDSDRCGREWCKCRCHVRPVVDGRHAEAVTR